MHNRFGENFALKIISVIIAIILWLIAIREQNPEITRNYENIPIEVVNENKFKQKGLTLMYDITDKVSISVRGRARDLERVVVDQLKGLLDLSEINRPGEHRLLIDIRGLPSGVTLRRKPEIIVKSDYLVYKDVAIVPKVDVKEAEGFLALSYRIKPSDTIKVFGPETLVRRIYQASVSLEANDVSFTVEQSLPVQLLDQQGKLIESKYINIEPMFVMITVPVYPLKTLPVEPNITGTPHDNYEVVEVEVYPREITVSGDKAVLDKMDSIGTQVMDIQDATADVKRTLKFQQYDGVFIAPSNPNEVEVLVRIKEKNIQRSLTIRNIQMINIPENRQAELETTSAEIVLSGPASIIKSMDEDSVKAYVDLSNVSRGEHRLKIMVDIPQGTEITEIKPNEATVKVK
jgi:YbbR domain-containing protein